MFSVLTDVRARAAGLSPVLERPNSARRCGGSSSAALDVGMVAERPLPLNAIEDGGPGRSRDVATCSRDRHGAGKAIRSESTALQRAPPRAAADTLGVKDAVTSLSGQLFASFRKVLVALARLCVTIGVNGSSD